MNKKSEIKEQGLSLDSVKVLADNAIQNYVNRSPSDRRGLVYLLQCEEEIVKAVQTANKANGFAPNGLKIVEPD